MENVKENNDLLKWIQNNGAMNLSVVIINSVVDLIINAIRSKKKNYTCTILVQ